MLNPKHVFDNFVSTTGNRFARAACLTFARASRPLFNPLFLHGPTSVGKTHLLHAIANQVIRQRPFEKVLLVTAEEMLNELYGALGDHLERFREKYTSADLLL